MGFPARKIFLDSWRDPGKIPVVILQGIVVRIYFSTVIVMCFDNFMEKKIKISIKYYHPLMSLIFNEFTPKTAITIMLTVLYKQECPCKSNIQL